MTKQLAVKAGCNPHFGLCPECGGENGYINIGREHWFVCYDHSVAWWGGSNRFSSWRDEDSDDRRYNRERFIGMRVIDPWYPPEDEVLRADFDQGLKILADLIVRRMKHRAEGQELLRLTADFLEAAIDSKAPPIDGSYTEVVDWPELKVES